MSKLIYLKNNDLIVKEELLKNKKLPAWIFWAYCYFLLEPDIPNRKFNIILRERMIGNRLAKYRKKRKLKELKVL